MYGPMDAEREDGQTFDASPSILSRLRPVLLAAALTAGLGAAVPFAAQTFIEPGFKAQTQIAAGSAGEDHIQSAIRELRSRAVLDNVIRALNLGSGDEFSTNRPTVSRVVSEVFSGEVTTVSQAEEAVRDRLGKAVSADYDAGRSGVVLNVVARDAASAAAIANHLGGELRRLLAAGDSQMRNPQVEAMRAAAARAQSALTGFTAKLDEPMRERLKKFQEDRTALDGELADAQQALSGLGEKQKMASAMTLSDVLAKPLPDSLEFTGLEYERQRYVDAELALQQLSINLGPLHPRRAAAQGVVDGAKRDIGSALRQLSSSLKQEAATAETTLATLKERKAALLADATLNDTARQLSSLQAAAGEARNNLEKLLSGTTASKPVAVALPPVLSPAMASAAERLGPDMTLLSAAGAGAGLLIGLSLAALRYRRQSRLAGELDAMPVDLDVTPAAMRHEPAVDPVLLDEPEADEFLAEDLHDHRERYTDHGLFAGSDIDPEIEQRFAANDTTFGDRIRSMLSDHRIAAEEADLPPVLAAAVGHSQVLRQQAGQSGQAGAADLDRYGIDYDSQEMQELLQLQQELAELRELVRLEKAARAMKVAS